MAYLDIVIQEDAGTLLEAVGILCREETCHTALRAAGVHIGMPTEIVGKALYYKVALRYDADAVRNGLSQRRHQQGIVGAAKDDGVDIRVFVEELHDSFPHKIVGTIAAGLSGFYYCCPQRTCLSADFDIGEELGHLKLITHRANGAFGSDIANMA